MENVIFQVRSSSFKGKIQTLSMAIFAFKGLLYEAYPELKAYHPDPLDKTKYGVRGDKKSLHSFIYMVGFAGVSCTMSYPEDIEEKKEAFPEDPGQNEYSALKKISNNIKNQKPVRG